MTSADGPVSLILIVGHDAVLLNTRAMLLESAGYIVESAYSVEEAVRRFRAGDFDLVVACHSIPDEEREGLVEMIRDGGAATPVIFVSINPCPDRYADLNIGNHPSVLLNAAQELLSQRKATGMKNGLRRSTGLLHPVEARGGRKP